MVAYFFGTQCSMWTKEDFDAIHLYKTAHFTNSNSYNSQFLPAHACVYSRHEQQYIKMSPPLLKIANIYQLIVWIRSVLKRDLIGNLILRPTQIPVSEWSLVMFHWPVTSPLRGHSYYRALAACKPRVRGLGFSNTASNVKFTNLME